MTSPTKVVRHRTIILLLTFFCVLIAGQEAEAHRDTVLQLATSEGKLNISELPTEYSPSWIDTKAGRLHVKNSSFQLPACLWSVYQEQQGLQFSISGSWYHDKGQTDLPDYLVIGFRYVGDNKAKTQATSIDYSFLISLEDVAPHSILTTSWVNDISPEVVTSLNALDTCVEELRAQGNFFPTTGAWTTSATVDMSCFFIPVESSRDKITSCAVQRSDGSLLLTESAIAEIALRSDGPVAVLMGRVIYYVNKKGRIARVLSHDNGADYFVEGLARTLRNQKVGFINERLIEVIEPVWDFAFPFDQGVALVCSGCSFETVGEYRRVVGGLWGRIDRDGKVVTAVSYAREALPD